MEVVLDEKAGVLEVTWKDFGRHRYPFVWLRDCCQCSECFHPVAKSRRTDLKDLDLNARPKTVKAESDSLEINWPDDHLSVFDGLWLRQRTFEGDNQNLSGVLRYQRKPRLWGSELNQTLPTISFDCLLKDDATLYKWITALEETGICLLTGAPTTQGQVNRIGERVAFLRKIHYGETFQVKDKVEPSNIAYTSAPLGMHTDTPYLTYIPGIQMLHCISQCTSEGGENQFADGFHVAEQLRKQHPDHFRLLSTFRVDFCDIGSDYVPFYVRARNYTIEVDKNGAVVMITFSNHTRDSVLRLPLEKVRPFYEALRAFYDLLYDPKNIIQLKLKPGEIICFHNKRVLHARTGFTVSSGDRHLEGAYVDWDDTLSRRRILEEKLNIHDVDNHI